jgi:hypothetical protein
LCSLILILVSLICFYFLKKICSIKYVLLAFFILSCKSIWLLLYTLNITPKYLKFSTLSNLEFFYFRMSCFIFI